MSAPIQPHCLRVLPNISMLLVASASRSQKVPTAALSVRASTAWKCLQ